MGAVVNSLSHVDPATLLDLHIGYMKEVRRGFHSKARARRYQRFRERLTLLGVPLPSHSLLVEKGSGRRTAAPMGEAVVGVKGGAGPSGGGGAVS